MKGFSANTNDNLFFFIPYISGTTTCIFKMNYQKKKTLYEANEIKHHSISKKTFLTHHIV